MIKTDTENSESIDYPNELDGIAVIGMACNFPGAKTVEQFWDNLCQGKETITKFSDMELKDAGVPLSDINNPDYVKAKPVLEDIDLFDAQFFKYTPREASMIDPQHRAMLECSWEALERSGYDPSNYDGRIGMYGGADLNTYLLKNIMSNPDIVDNAGTILFLTGNDKDYLCTRIAYKLNLTGPSFTVQSACSTSMVAIHLAAEALMIGECDMALAGGACISVPHYTGYLYKPGSVESPDARCRAFDSKANGTVFGNGVGVVVLKRLSDAIADGDQIYSVIRGSAINNDGALRAGYTAPGVDGQASVITEALSVAGVNPESISYIEAHGTGTELGDPIEVEALIQAYRRHTDKKAFCGLGSVKTNFGHLSTASGAAAIIKTSLAMKNKKLPPSLHFKEGNPKIDFENSPFFVNTKLIPWETENNNARLAGVSSFGIGGTNAHIILEEAPGIKPSDPSSNRYQLLTISGNTKTALDTATDNLGNFLTENTELNLADAAYTLHVGRQAFKYRRIAVANTTQDASEALMSLNPVQVVTGPRVTEKKQIVFMFPGQGSQYVNMGFDLYKNEPVFRKYIDLCSQILKPHLNLDLCSILYPDESNIDEASEMLTKTEFTQPALFVIEYALAQLWMSIGIEPKAMIGHSIGEYTAACLSGVFDLNDALMLVAMRGKLMQSLPGGVMLSVPLPESELKELLDDTLAIGVINHPEHCVVSGPEESIKKLEEVLLKKEIEGRRLKTSHAFHSPMMEPILETFISKIKSIKFNEPGIPFISNYTGTWITAEQAVDPLYWANHLRNTVRFADGAGELLETNTNVLLEVGPGNVLKTLLKHHPKKDNDQGVIASMRHPKEDAADDFMMVSALGQLWLYGAPIDWKNYHKNEFRHRVVLPTYPFERKRYWIEEHADKIGIKGKSGGQLFKDPDLSNWFYIPSWKRTQPPVSEFENIEGNWLLFTDESSFSESMKELLKNYGLDVMSVKPGEKFNYENNEFVLNPASREDYKNMIKTLEKEGKLPTHIIHLWNLASQSEEKGKVNNDTLNKSFYSLLFLAQELEAHTLNNKLHIAVVSNSMQKTAEGEKIDPEKASLLGISRVIPQEMPNINIRSIDISIPLSGSHKEEWTAKQIITEILTEQLDRIIAYRGYDRLIQAFEPAPINSDEGLDKKLRPGGVYLITGGLGGIGLTLAHDLARTVQPKLVLVNRSKLPDRKNWKMWIDTHDPNDRISLRIKAVQSLEDAGAEVLILSADVTNNVQLKKAVKEACKHFGTIHGVIHSAGLQDGDWIRDKSVESVERIFAPKIAGSKVLIDVFSDMKLDFIMLFSSIMSLIAIAGQADYCAGNSFIDAFAMSQDDKSETPVISIDWDEWAEVGMGVNAALSNMIMYGQKNIKKLNPRDITHPVINNTYNESDEKAVYEMILDPEKQWFLSEHIRMGYSMVPATAYLELIRASYSDYIKNPQLVIKDVIFLSPFLVGNGDTKKAHVVLEKNPGSTDFQLLGLEGTNSNGDPIWHTFVSGELDALSSIKLKHYNIEEIRSECKLEEIKFGFNTKEERSTVSNPRWKSVRHAYIGKNKFFAEIELGNEFNNDQVDYKLHPALLDLATGFFIDEKFLPYLNNSNNSDQKYYYLPMSYKNLQVLGDMPGKFYSYVQIIQDDKSDDLTVKVSLINEEGYGFIEIEAYTLKRMNINESSESEDKPVIGNIQGKDEKYYKRFKNSILPDEGIEIFRRIIAGNRLSQIVVCTKNLPVWLEDLKTASPDDLADIIPDTDSEITLHPRPDLKTAYAAPTNEMEEKLASIWQSKIGVEKVGINDNFFELGGDSILGIQIVAQAKKMGIALTPKNLFEHQTIYELASVVGKMTSSSESNTEKKVQDESDTDIIDYPLTPMQENMLHRRLNFPETGLYLWFSIFPIRKLDVAAFEKAWQWIVNRHENLRISFVWEDTPNAYQKIHENVKVNIEQEDLQGHPPEMQMMRIQEYIQSVRMSGFDLKKVPPIRLALFQVAPDDYRFVWSINYMLLDGWSYSLILKEMFAFYDAYTQGQELQMDPVQPTNEYLKWLHKQDLKEAENFWKKSLEQFIDCRSLVSVQAEENKPDTGLNYIHSTQPLIVSPEITAKLQALSREYHVTLNTLVQGAWAILLSHLTNDEKVLFGVTSSGRSAAWEGIENLAGFFINTLPVGIKVSHKESISKWLQKIQVNNSEIRQYEYTPVQKIKEWMGIPDEKPYPDSYMVFENFPVDASIGVWAKRLEISETRVLVQTEHPLRIEVYPGQIIAMMFNYYQKYFTESMITRMVTGMHTIFENMINNPGQNIESILKVIENI